MSCAFPSPVLRAHELLIGGSLPSGLMGMDITDCACNFVSLFGKTNPLAMVLQVASPVVDYFLRRASWRKTIDVDPRTCICAGSPRYVRPSGSMVDADTPRCSGVSHKELLLSCVAPSRPISFAERHYGFVHDDTIGLYLTSINHWTPGERPLLQSPPWPTRP